jgi:hypothetical protein
VPGEDRSLAHPTPPRLRTGSGARCMHFAEANRLAYMQAPCAYASTERRISFQPHWRGKSLQYLAAAAIPVLVRLDKIIRGTLWVPTVGPARHVVGAEAERQVFCEQPCGLRASAAIRLPRRCKGDSRGQLPLLSAA